MSFEFKALLLASAASLILSASAGGQTQMSDRKADGFRGRVKAVTTESAKLKLQDGKWFESEKQFDSVVMYASDGKRLKQVLYDYRGNVYLIRQYSVVDGDKVVVDENILHDYNPPPIVIGPRVSSNSRDSRFTYRFKYKYDSKGNRLEETWYHSDGTLWLRYVSVYDGNGNEVEWFRYTAQGKLNGRRVSAYDPKGQVIEQSWFKLDGSISEKWSYTYEVDSQANWIKRRCLKWITRYGESFFEPYEITYRQITYF